MLTKYSRLLSLKVLTFRRRFFLSSRICDSNFNSIKPDVKKILQNSTYEVKNPTSDVWYSSLYSLYPEKKRLQSEQASWWTDPSETSILLFPDQGSQHFLGMYKDILNYPAVRGLYEEACAILECGLLDLCLNDPEKGTFHSQVAVMVASLAAVEKLRAINEEVIDSFAATAGLGVGEYSALVYGGAIEFKDAVRLLKIREEAMQMESYNEPGGMMAVFLRPEARLELALAAAKEWCEKQTPNAECGVAIYLFPDCRVISGNLEALKFLEANAENFAIEKIKYLPVSGAFHSKLMIPAREVLEESLRTTPMQRPLTPVHSNIDGLPYLSVDKIRDNLAKQLCEPIRWEQTMYVMFERKKGAKYPYVFEYGPGTSLNSILRFNNLAYKKCFNMLEV